VCVRPIRAYQTSDGSVFFSEVGQRDFVRTLELSCQQCIECRLERSRQWAVRCVQEASLHVNNCFITLTYARDPVTLIYDDFQKFMKRLRKRFACFDVELGHWVPRFFAGGEYGEQLGRPHFHACLFGVDFPDKVFLRRSESGFDLFRSPVLEALWPSGFSTVGNFSFESAAYVARYVMAKVNGDQAEAWYRVVDPDTGEVIDRVPEFCHMSLRPGIGALWLDRYRSDVYPHGLMVVNGKEVTPPKYYERRYKRFAEGSEELASLEERRARARRERGVQDSTDERLKVREQVAAARVRLYRRKLK